MRNTAAAAGHLDVRLTALAVLVVALVGCRTTVSGHEAKPPGEPNLDGVSVGQLHTGNYPTKPVPPVRIGTNPGPPYVLEGQRMAGYTVGPSEVDAALTEIAGLSTMPIAGGPNVGGLFGDTRAAVATAHGLVAGFSTARHSGGIRIDRSLLNVVLLFPDAPSAAAAVGEMNAADPAGGPLAQDPPPRHPTGIPRYPDAAAQEIDETTGNGISVESFTAHGRYVLAQYVQTLDGLNAAAALVAATLDLQGPRIDQFVPTDPAQLAGLPIDPTGLFTHTLPAPKGSEAPFEGVYSPQGALHLEDDPATAWTLFTAAGVDAVSLRGEAVYRAKDPAGAQRVVDGFAAYWAGKARPIDGVSGMPAARCFDRGAGLPLGEVRYLCLAHAERYAFTVGSQQAEDARQQAAAQYLVLAQW